MSHSSRPVEKDILRQIWASAGTRGLGMIINYQLLLAATLYMLKLVISNAVMAGMLRLALCDI